LQLDECTEFSVALPNRPGAFAELSAKLTARGVRLRAFMVYTSFVMNVPDQPQVVGLGKLVADDEGHARAALQESGFRFREQRALLLRSAERRDLMPVILRKLADAGLNLIDAYGVFPRDNQGELLVVLTVSDERKGYEIASRLDWSVIGT
jgi:hypothetical protein